MPRPRKIDDSRSRSFLLPSPLLEQMEEAARDRDIEVSDVLREILQEGIEKYLDESKRRRRERLERSVEEVTEDPHLGPHFREYKKARPPAVPLNTGLPKKDLMRLIDALQAEQELKSQPEPFLDPVLQRMAKRLNEKNRDHVYGIQELIDTGKVRVKGQPDKVWLLVDPEVMHMIKKKIRDDEAVEHLRELIDQGVLKKDGMDGEEVIFSREC
jgi:hypothetical protein